VRRRSPETFRDGELVGTDGKNLGTHAGHQHFTIGQRKGVGVAFGRPIYVVDINAEQNRVTVGEKEDLLRSTLTASQINLLSTRLSANSGPVNCSAKIRYNHAPQAAVAEVIGDQLRVTFDEPQTAITPGQAVVVYDNDVLLGGGWID
jgi:tRNA-specific 2-thiouridylase